MIKKISITGPESSGKSELAVYLAHAFNTVYVPEYSREYLAGLSRPYQEEDILNIAKGQIEAENQQTGEASKYLFCDTDILVCYIWSLYKYGHCDPWLGEKLETHTYDLYLLCAPDLPWTPDPLRENPYDREELFELYKLKLDTLDLPYRIVQGKGEQRLYNTRKIIEEFFIESI